MKKTLKLEIIIIVITILTLSNIISNPLKVFKNNTKSELNVAGYWNLTGSPIYIDDSDPTRNWSKTAAENDWCSGSGTYTNPYKIENLVLDAQNAGNAIEIRNSNDYFVLRNCTLINSSNGIYDAGIKLSNVRNGKLLENNCSNNNRAGILMMTSSNDNNVSGNIVTNNGAIGIYIRDNSDNNNISGNMIIDNGGTGIELINFCDYNIIEENEVSNNGDEGIGILGSQFNNITGNDVSGNFDIGITFQGTSENNLAYFNFIIREGAPHSYVIDLGTTNKWNNSEIGNYYDIYSGVDDNQDGIGDDPFEIGSGSGIYDYRPIFDDQVPNITINSPKMNDVFSFNAPIFNVEIKDKYLKKMWYTLDNGIKNYTFTENGTIDQFAWDILLPGFVILKFYAIDRPGHIRVAEINITKDIQVPMIKINYPYRNELFGINPPRYTIEITDESLDKMWYSLFDGTYLSGNYSFTELEGTIDINVWNSYTEGSIEIIFYANDSLGRIGFQNISIQKTSGFLQFDPLTINNYITSNKTWVWASTQKWCSGSGTWSDPYIIDSLKINGQNSTSCITILNSNEFFIIRNCFFNNSGNGTYDGGIKLEQVSNGDLIDNNCSFNNANGIILDSCQYINITSNTVNYNTLSGIYLINCNNISILNNDETISNNYYGIFLFNSHYNTIIGNMINYNQIGIFLNQSNSNFIDWNNLMGNGRAIVDNGENNIIGANNVLPSELSEFPFEILLIILIVGIVVIGVIGAVVLVKKRISIPAKKEKVISEKKEKKSE